MSDTHAEVNHEAYHAASSSRELVACGGPEAAGDSCEAVARTWAATGRFVSRFVYTTCYTISYGVVFSTTLLAQAIPTNNAAVRGLIDGAHAAVHRIDLIQDAAIEAPGGASAALAPA